MEGELIFVGFIMLIGQIILMQMWQNGWFKKENFKIKKANLMAENKIKMRKLERELGLTPGIEPKEKKGAFDTIKDLAPLLKNLNGEQIGALIEKFTGGTEEEEEGDVESMLMDYAVKNPDVVKEFLAGLTEGKETTKSEGPGDVIFET